MAKLTNKDTIQLQVEILNKRLKEIFKNTNPIPLIAYQRSAGSHTPSLKKYSTRNGLNDYVNIITEDRINKILKPTKYTLKKLIREVRAEANKQYKQANKMAEGGKVNELKKPWEMTFDEYYDLKNNERKKHGVKMKAYGNFKEHMRIRHKEEIEYALNENKPVPPEVLADYPDLQEKSLKEYQKENKSKGEINLDVLNKKIKDLNEKQPYTYYIIVKGKGGIDYKIDLFGNSFRLHAKKPKERLFKQTGLLTHHLQPIFKDIGDYEEIELHERDVYGSDRIKEYYSKAVIKEKVPFDLIPILTESKEYLSETLDNILALDDQKEQALLFIQVIIELMQKEIPYLYGKYSKDEENISKKVLKTLLDFDFVTYNEAIKYIEQNKTLK